MQAGKFNARVTLRRSVGTTKDGMGASVPNWANLATRIAAVHTPLSDGEVTRAAQTQGRMTDRWEVRQGRAWADLSNKDQLVDDAGRVHEILRVKPTGRRLKEGLEITTCAAAEPQAPR